ncbi:unnamed protein product [Ilex paraguariensis]|uniref:Uncharacterized protein n=1 Tax=Ilex paraguariensis TaxID=185542 RepID=A0ABC8SM72_9AQUA
MTLDKATLGTKTQAPWLGVGKGVAGKALGFEAEVQGGERVGDAPGAHETHYGEHSSHANAGEGVGQVGMGALGKAQANALGKVAQTGTIAVGDADRQGTGEMGAAGAKSTMHKAEGRGASRLQVVGIEVIGHKACAMGADTCAGVVTGFRG